MPELFPNSTVLGRLTSIGRRNAGHGGRRCKTAQGVWKRRWKVKHPVTKLTLDKGCIEGRAGRKGRATRPRNH